MKRSLFAEWAFLPEGWRANVRLSWDVTGQLDQVEAGAEARPGETQVRTLVPGMVNLHSHAFQRAMAGLAEVASPAGDSFWTWREHMYRLALRITPEEMCAVAAQLYAECLQQGYTSVCEFHYLHHDVDGAPYQRPVELAERVLEAAAHTGMGITLLPVLYRYADFSGTPLRDDQRRFRSDADTILAHVAALEAQRGGQVEIGAAPHSLRAAGREDIARLLAGLPHGRPVHIHIAEQQREVQACLAATGQRPLAWLLHTGWVDARWCLVHATHLHEEEIRECARSAAVVGLCPSTEGNLGDGVFPLAAYLQAGGRIGIGSDSHVSQSPVEELRWLEYGQRLVQQRRNIATRADRARVGDCLWQACLEGGAQASGRRVGRLAPGYRADFFTLDTAHPHFAGAAPEDTLNLWLFSGQAPLVRDVYVGGVRVVEQGQHRDAQAIGLRYAQALRRLRAA